VLAARSSAPTLVNVAGFDGLRMTVDTADKVEHTQGSLEVATLIVCRARVFLAATQ
jgi:hypothetical protein